MVDKYNALSTGRPMSIQTTTEKKISPQEIYESLKAMITALEIIPGTRVTETQLADFFSVSRTPIRAALQRLEAEGLLTVKPKQGCFIRNIDMLQISHYYDVRVVLENMVLDTIHEEGKKSELEKLAAQWNPETLAFGVELTEALKEAEEDFHYQLARISGNSALCSYIADINDHIRAVRRLGWPDSQSITDTYKEHHLICKLLLTGKLEKAKAEMTKHIRKSQEQANRITLHQLYTNPKVVNFSA